MERDGQNIFVILDRFWLVFYPTNNPVNQSFEKWEKRLEILSF